MIACHLIGRSDTFPFSELLIEFAGKLYRLLVIYVTQHANNCAIEALCNDIRLGVTIAGI